MNIIALLSLRAKNGIISRLEREKRRLEKQINKIDDQIRAVKQKEPKPSTGKRQPPGFIKALLIDWFRENNNHPTRVSAIARELKLKSSSVRAVLWSEPTTFAQDGKCWHLAMKIGTVDTNKIIEPEV